MADLPQLLKRLETVTVRLEEIASKGGVLSAGSAKTSPTAAASSAGSDSNSPSLVSFDEILNGPLKQLIDSSAKIGGLVQEQVSLPLFRFRC